MAVSANNNPKILIAEDDPSLREQLARQLTSQGYRVLQSHQGDQALVAALGQRLDMILLDVLLPTMNGFEVLQRLRKTCQTPVMMLTNDGSEDERILGYQQGADDCVPKPFSYTELFLRIEALLRRTRGALDHRSEPSSLSVGELQLDRQTMQVFYKERPLTLTPIQFRLLWILVLHQREPLSKPYLYRVVLEKEFSRYDRSLDMHLSRIRRKLVEVGMAGDRLQTVHGKGYCFW
ncbi:transcriptional regulatory protein OmpR [Marinobacter sp. JH2]|uniref:response regulator transcription factor n=1 Tax=Marinobacter sp. AL4B TaxID=2871173 RepID=UPI0010556244|nr:MULTISPECIES: response regulator transcription factor [unclassified Marinobacter]MBZ0335026.1 response regulator transcription factor [Marinobacter sp. AL4B]QBM18968.1 transcriptional regulatory protein OmpR [Marinobacter sp. JH2]